MVALALMSAAIGVAIGAALAVVVFAFVACGGASSAVGRGLNF